MTRNERFRPCDYFFNSKIICLCLLGLIAFSGSSWALTWNKVPDPPAAAENPVLDSKEDSEGMDADQSDTASGSFADFLIGEKKKPSDSIETMDEVTVVASRLPSDQEKLRDVPSNVSYKDSDELSLTHPLTFQDAVKDVEGVVLYDQVGNGVDQEFSMRGFNTSESVTVLVDGVRMNDVDGGGVNFPLIRSNGFDSVQVDKGSSSPVYGSGSFAGVVNITTRKPSEKPVSIFGGYEMSSFKGLRFYDGVSGTLQDKLTPIGGKWSYYFNGGRDMNRGFRNNGDWRITDFDFKTAYELPDERGRIHALAKHVEDAVRNPGEITLQQFEENPKQTNKEYDHRKYKSTVIAWGADLAFWDKHVLVSYLTSLRYAKCKFITTYGTFSDADNAAAPNTDLFGTKNREIDSVIQAKYVNEWSGIGSETLIGAEWRNGYTHQIRRDAFYGKLSEGDVAERDRNARPESFGLFWQEKLKFWDKVIPYVGMRHEFASVRTLDELNAANALSKRWHDSAVSAGLTVHPLNWMDLFGNYSQGFKVPTGDDFAGTTDTNLRPETSNSYELGGRLRYKNLAALKSSYFLIDVQDEIVYDAVAQQNVNIGGTRRYGLENRLEVNPFEELNSYLSYTWTEAYIRETNSTSIWDDNLKDGRGLGLIPHNRIGMGFFLTPLKRLGDPYDGFKLGLDGLFVGKQHPSNYESADQATLDSLGGAAHRIKGYSVWNFHTSFNWRGKEIYFKINNLFDEKYYSRSISGSSWGSATYPLGNYTWVNPGAPREFVLGLKWEF